MIEGSSKIFAHLGDNHWLMQFKDDIHGRGQHAVIKETGKWRRVFTYHFYRYLESHGIKTHLTSDELREDGIIVEKCDPIKMEFLVRNVARGHWVDLHKVPLFEGGVRFDQPIVEMCVKMKLELSNGDLLDDPRITPLIALELHRQAKDPVLRGHMIQSLDEAKQAEALALEINSHYQTFLQAHGLVLEDFKFELGRLNGEIVLIDEISPDSSRVRDHQGGSLTKDLFREKKPMEEIVKNYRMLAESMELSYAR